MGSITSCCPFEGFPRNTCYTFRYNYSSNNNNNSNSNNINNNNNNTNFNNSNVFQQNRPVNRNSTEATNTQFSRGRFTAGVGSRANTREVNNLNGRCEVCGIHLDPSLLDGHQEVCRINARRINQLQEERQQRVNEERSRSIERFDTFNNVNFNQNYNCEHNNERMSDENEKPVKRNSVNEETYNKVEQASSEEQESNELCVVCLDKPREYAFIPCGHIACCNKCVYLLETCPICRSPRSALCHVAQNTLSQYHCPSCKLFIAPTYFEGHREVCATLMREKKKALNCKSTQNLNENEAIISKWNAAEGVKEINASSEEQITLNDCVIEEPFSKREGILCDNNASTGRQICINEIEELNKSLTKSLNNDKEYSSSERNIYSKKCNDDDNDCHVVNEVDDFNSSKYDFSSSKGDVIQEFVKTIELTNTASKQIDTSNSLQCIECNQYFDHLMLCLPCGHRVMCERCSQKRTTCPVCLHSITKVIIAY